MTVKRIKSDGDIKKEILCHLSKLYPQGTHDLLNELEVDCDNLDELDKFMACVNELERDKLIVSGIRSSRTLDKTWRYQILGLATITERGQSTLREL